MEQRLDYYSLVGFKSGSTSPDELARLRIEPERTALFLDFDGTFVDIAPTPDAIRVTDRDKTLLDQLSKRTSGAVSVISGRNLHEIDSYLSDFQGTVSGGHGAEMRREAKALPTIKCDLERLEHIKCAVREFAAVDPRILAEDKSFGIVLHFRQHPELEGKVRDFVRSLVGGDADFEIQQAKMALEIKPKGISKAMAIERIMKFKEFRRRTILFAGDDDTDEIAFSWVNEQGGITIKIGDGLTLARYRTRNPASFKKWLREQLKSASKGA
ncbi:trehalose 6-phosphatase [Hoeflea marina]|uniref:Trehalose 6-phosphate phosphatase n=2 Tax=Hoeflea marina TaxID=274592 RepID=A0A317PTL3_9HYPH|nr:trehalose 6-phosphatase [Hoeflea marina]